ncbi:MULTISPECIES: hypothetical protein [Pseudomonas]|uniref:hypothetical protein n=1 Tax=Pseudomonas TaxID=286 RepID=UPI0007434E66|nr:MULTISPECIES: hypothetical protein [Pseudomonas]KUM41374.1 hypothetical protein AR540_07570 [Pseudomonas sp. EpS/L25]MDT3722058.1 hypothetical protein [Pseudomonas oryzihabitans]
MISPDVPVVKVPLREYAALARAMGATVFAQNLEKQPGELVGWRFPKGCFVQKAHFQRLLGRQPDTL